MTTFIDLHVLQSVPPSNLNRDESGSPKTAIYGGVRRHRVSSQSWKKAIRDYYNENFAENNISFRTKNVGELVVKEILRISPSTAEEDAAKLTVDALKELKIIGSTRSEKGEISADSLFLISQKQVEALAHVLTTVTDEKELKKAIKTSLITLNSLDLALFGRMVASNGDLNIEATSQFAHAISTHAVSNEFDFFTAVDDFSLNDHAGAAMIGDVEFNSSTLYRYATINVDELSKNFTAEPEVLKKALKSFIDSFVKAIPSGKQNSFAALTLPEVVLISVRNDQPVSFAGAFEKPVTTTDNGFVTPSVKQLVSYIKNFSSNYETTPAPKFAVVANDNDKEEISQIAGLTSLAQLEENVVNSALGE